MTEDSEFSDEMMPYKPITENPIEIDLKEWQSRFDIFELIKRKLGLPGDCGENWDAIWDMAWGFSENPVTIEFHGVLAARERFPRDVKIMLEVFERLQKECPRIEHVVID